MSNSCSWCVMGVCRLGAGKEKDCDWSNIPYTQEGISQRMDFERQHIIDLCKEITQTKDWILIQERIKLITDISKGMDTMSIVLEREFGFYKRVEDIIFASALSSAIIHSKIIEKKEQRKSKR